MKTLIAPSLQNDVITTVYRAYDPDGTLLYVGISSTLRNRLHKHFRSGDWIDYTTRIELSRYPSRSEALAEEGRAIVNEAPVFNIQGRDRVESKALVDLYLSRTGERTARPWWEECEPDSEGSSLVSLPDSRG